MAIKKNLLSNPSLPSSSLLRVLGLLFGIAVSIGGTLGVGILRQPGPVAAYLRHPWLIVLMWFGGAIYSLLGALSFAELAAMIPKAGGIYAFAREAMGETAGFAVGWSDFLANVTVSAYAAIAATEFLGRVIHSVDQYPRTLGASVIVAFAVIQWFGIRVSGRLQQAASALGAASLLGLGIACLTMPGSSHLAAAPPVRTSSLTAALVLAAQSIIVTYDGWYEPIYFAEETQRPARQIPRAMFGGLALIASIYLLLNLAFLKALGSDGLAASRFAAADAAKLVFGHGGDVVLSLIAVIILLTLLHVVLMTATRIFYAISRDGLFWNGGAQVATNGTPRPALAVTTIVAVGLVLSGTVDRLIALAGFFYVANYCWSYISLLVLRHKQPQALRPFRVPAFPAPTLVALAASLIFLIGATVKDPTNSLIAMSLLGASYPIHLLWPRSFVERQRSDVV